MSYIPKQRLVGNRRKYTTVPMTNGTFQASAQPLLLTHPSEHLSSPSLLGAPAFNPEPQGVVEPEPSHTKARKPLGQMERQDMKCLLLVWFFWVSCKVCPRKTHPSRDDSKICRQAPGSNSFKSLVTTFPFELTNRVVSQN